MNASFLKTAVFSIALIDGASSMSATTGTALSEMTSSEIISMIPVASPAATRDIHEEGAKGGYISLTGEDLITKAYGTIPAINSKEKTINLSETLMSMTPAEEDNALWLDSADGYCIDYNGMTPDVSALVRIENDSISDYGFFFLFPYSEVAKKYVTTDQVDFSKTMLQEFEDLGLDLGANPYTSDLFEVSGEYTNNVVGMRLIDDTEGERYILMLSVEPNGLTEADLALAE